MYIRNQCQLLHYAQSVNYVLLHFNAQCHLAAALALAARYQSHSRSTRQRGNADIPTVTRMYWAGIHPYGSMTFRKNILPPSSWLALAARCQSHSRSTRQWRNADIPTVTRMYWEGIHPYGSMTFRKNILPLSSWLALAARCQSHSCFTRQRRNADIPTVTRMYSEGLHPYGSMTLRKNILPLSSLSENKLPEIGDNAFASAFGTGYWVTLKTEISPAFRRNFQLASSVTVTKRPSSSAVVKYYAHV
jgi:hypothetical protein